MEFDSGDRISGLPDFVIHTILSLLPREDAARTSVLSKRWNRLWETFPYLIFEQVTYTKVPTQMTEITPDLTQKVAKFLDTVKLSLLRSARCGVRATLFHLDTAIFDPELSHKLDECLNLALESSSPGIQVSNMVPRGVVLPEVSFVSDRFRSRSLQALFLTGVRLSEKSINNVFLSCPDIQRLLLMNVPGFAKLDIDKLDKLESLWVVSAEQLNVNIVDAPKLELLCFASLALDMRCTLDLSSCCRSLRALSLSRIGITDERLRSLIARCPVLDYLGITACRILRNVTISAKCLASLALLYCDEIVTVDVDAPALLSFKHEGESLPRLALRRVPTQLEFVHTLKSHDPIHTSRFVNLTKFLAIYTLPYSFMVTVDPWEEVVFDREELHQFAIPPAFQLEHLKVELGYQHQFFEEQALVDGLLWSCHPKMISVFLKQSAMPHSCVTVLSKSLLETEKNPRCCGSSQVKCWRHGLKSATAQSFEESGVDKPVICFELEWDSDSIW